MALFVNAMFFVLLAARPVLLRRLDVKKAGLQKDSVGGDLEMGSLAAMHQPKTLDAFEKLLVAAQDRTVIVDFTASWCGPCQRIKPVYEALEQEKRFDHVIFCKIDVDDNEETAQKYGVSAMPTFMAFRRGMTPAVMKGAVPDKLKEFVEMHQGDRSAGTRPTMDEMESKMRWATAGGGHALGTVSASDNGEAKDESQSAAESPSVSAASEREKRAAALAKRGL